MKKIIIALLAASMMGAGVLAGCGGGSEPAPAPAPDDTAVISSEAEELVPGATGDVLRTPSKEAYDKAMDEITEKIENSWMGDTGTSFETAYWIYKTDTQGDRYISGLAALVSRYDDMNDTTNYYTVTGALVPGWESYIRKSAELNDITFLVEFENVSEAKAYVVRMYSHYDGIAGVEEADSYDDSGENETPSTTTQYGLEIPDQATYDDAVNEALSTFKERQREGAEVKYAKWVFEYNEDKDADGTPGPEDTDLAGLALIFHAKAENSDTYYYILKTVPMRDGWDGMLEKNDPDLVLIYKDYYENYEEAEQAMNGYIGQSMTMTADALN